MTTTPSFVRRREHTHEPVEPSLPVPGGPVEYILGIPFADLGGDTARCALCGQPVDVGAELREHAAWHRGEI